MNFTPGERAMIRKALTAMAEQYTRESKSRRWIGPNWSRIRADARQMATNFTTLSKDERLS